MTPRCLSCVIWPWGPELLQHAYLSVKVFPLFVAVIRKVLAFLPVRSGISSRSARGKNAQASKSNQFEVSAKVPARCSREQTNPAIDEDALDRTLSNDFSWLWGAIIATCTDCATKELEPSHITLTFLIPHYTCTFLNVSVTIDLGSNEADSLL